MRKYLFSLFLLCVSFSASLAGEGMPALSVTCSYPGSLAAEWHTGDKLIVYHNGNTYNYVTAQSGEQTIFLPEVQQGTVNYDPSMPVTVYFNVEQVKENGEAIFSIKSEQCLGDSSGRLPQWATFIPGESVSEVLAVKMSPLATVIELTASSAESFRVDRLVLMPLNSASGYTSVSGIKVDPQTGTITYPSQTSRPTIIGLSAENTNLSERPRFSFIVAGVHPGNQGLVVDFFKERRNNMRSVILRGTNAGKNSVPVYMQIDLGQKQVGISSASEFNDFRNSLGRIDPLGLKYCDEDGVICLKTDIDVSSFAGEGMNWEGIKDLRTDFDGKGHTIYGYKISRSSSATIFASTSASIRNVNFGRPGDYLEVNGGDYSIAGPIGLATNPNSVIEGCVNRSEIRSSDACSGSVMIAGIVARGSCSISNCANLGKVTMGSSSSTGVKYAGGVVGNVVGDMSTASNSILSCVNRADIISTTSEKAWIGGIGGRISENAKAWYVDGCYNKGTISITSFTERINIVSFLGGIIAEMSLPATPHGALHNLKGCHNSGAVITNADGRICMGGILGSAKGTFIESCINSGEVSHLQGLDSEASLARNFANIGGIAGSLGMGGVAKECENTASGKVFSNYSVAHRMGGIVGAGYKSQILQCRNSAPVCCVSKKMANSLFAAGGICGLQEGSSLDIISGCTNAGDVSMTVNTTGMNAVAGGVLAVLTRGCVENSTNSGNVNAINQLALPYMNCVAGGVVGRVHNNIEVVGVRDCSSLGSVIADAPYTPEDGLIKAEKLVGHYDE